MNGTARPPHLSRFRTRAMAATLVAAAALLSACGGDSSAGGGDVTVVPTAAAGQDPLAPQALKERTTIKVGLSSKLEVYLPILLGQEFGEFEKENLEVQVEYMPPTDSPLLLTQGKLDIIYSGFTAGVLNLISGNKSVRFAYPGGTVSSDTQGIYLTNAFPEISALTAADFKGKKIMTSSGSASSTSYFLWKKATELTGGDSLQPTDINWEASQLPEIPLILKRGAADGGQVISPYHNQLLSESCCKIFPGAYPKSPQTGYLVGPALAGKKDVALAFFRTLARTERTYLQGNYHDDAKVLEAMAKTMEQKSDVLAKGDPTVFGPALETNANVFPDLQKFFRAFGDISYPEDLPIEQIYDLDYVNTLTGKR
ncbi:ABC transporter substrate-binding protein [Acrocarpospora catenulata]|uniref:ABC transporter substrate-binding protein n=1 Tax=Acrocarpospora catenulata TaxID=2836182 RepID=UPI001BDA2371|nr:hypothetical protein [Acrocarpospora catenulata]